VGDGASFTVSAAGEEAGLARFYPRGRRKALVPGAAHEEESSCCLAGMLGVLAPQ
jgi:hypothetical protein